MDINTEILHQFETSFLLVNRAGEITFANQKVSEKSGYRTSELIGKNIKELLRESEWLFQFNHGVATIVTKGGEEYPASVEVNLFKGKKEYGIILSDIQMSGLDPLTMLPNRYLFTRFLQNAIKKAKEASTLVAVFYIDLDRFKFINDTLGHSYGDLLLNEVANVLKNYAGDSNHVARMGGDEFIFLAEDLQQENEIDSLAQELLNLFQKPFQLKEIEIYVSVSIGFSIYPYDGDELESLIINADSAMYRAKRKGHSKIEKSRMDAIAGSFEKLMIENSLYHAAANNELQLHFQPQIDWKENTVSGMEALLRWEHPVLGSIPPAEFIPIAEETGLILPIGDWVLREACAKIKEWMEEGNKNVRIAVNLSAKQFLQNDLADKISRVINEFQIPANCLEIEITESMMIYDIESATDILTTLKSLGVFITIDDFGKGHSSLQYLQRLPLDTIKIDRSFITDIDTNPSSKALSKVISNLGHALNMRVIAEGVETELQLRHVQMLRCDAVQGFYYSKPLSSEEANRFLNNHKGEKELCKVSK